MVDVFVVPDLGNLIAQWVATLILFLIIRHFVYKPMMEFLEKRKNYVHGQIEEAEKEREQAESLRQEYQEKLSSSKKEAEEILENARNRGREIEKIYKEDGQKKADHLVEKAKEQILQEKEIAMKDLKEKAGNLAVSIAERIIEEKMNEEKNQRIMNQVIDDLEQGHV